MFKKESYLYLYERHDDVLSSCVLFLSVDKYFQEIIKDGQVSTRVEDNGVINNLKR